VDTLFFDRAGAIRRCIVVLVASTLLSACRDETVESLVEDETAEYILRYSNLTVYGLGRDEQPDQEPVSWLASIRTFREDSFPGEGGFVLVGILEYNNYTVQDEIDWRRGQDVIGSCEFADDPVTGGGGSPPYVSGGTSVVINSPSGPWARLPIGNDLNYLLEPIPGPLPTGATLSIPGSTFPSVGAFPLSEPQAPVRTSPLPEENVGVSTSFTWQAPDDSDSIIAVDFLEYDTNGRFIGFPFYCYTEDDGAFTLPADAAVSLAAQSNDIRVRYSRISRRIDIVDGVLFFTRTSVAE